MAYAMIDAFIPEDLEQMDKEYWKLLDKYREVEGKESLRDEVDEQMNTLKQFVDEYRATWAYAEGELVAQEQDMLFVAFNKKLPEVKRAVSDWEESSTWDQWIQVGGDVNAASCGAVFCQPDKYGYEFAEIINLDEACGDRGKDDSRYWVETHYVDRSNLDGKNAEEAMRSCSRGADYEWTNLDIADAMREYGGYSSGYATGADTLKEAMDRHDIPREVLWNPAEYDVVFEEEKEEEPSNSRGVYCQDCGNYLTEEELSVYPLQWQYSGDMYCARHETRAQFKKN